MRVGLAHPRMRLASRIRVPAYRPGRAAANVSIGGEFRYSSRSSTSWSGAEFLEDIQASGVARMRRPITIAAKIMPAIACNSIEPRAVSMYASKHHVVTGR